MCEHVGEPCICRLSAVLDKLPNLEQLDLSHNGLTALPEAVNQLSRLTYLDLRGNKLKGLPYEIQKQFANAKVILISFLPVHVRVCFITKMI